MIEHSLHNAVLDTRAVINMTGDDLMILSRAFEATGNGKVAGQLSAMAERLDDVMEHLYRTFSDDLARQVAESTQASTNMVMAAFAGIEVGNRARDDQKDS